MRSKILHQLVILFIVGLFFQTHAYAATIAGKVLFVKGNDAFITSPTGKRRQAKRGLPIWDGDWVQSGKHALQMRFTDGSTVSLDPNSNFRVEKYKFNGKNDGQEKGIFKLLKGGLRTISGYIGHGKDPDAYQMKTAVANIGIRGTEYILRIQNGATKIWVIAGRVIVQNQAGKMLVNAKQAALVKDKNTAPQSMAYEPDLNPPSSNDPLPGKQPSSSSSSNSEEPTSQSSQATSSSDAQPAEQGQISGDENVSGSSNVDELIINGLPGTDEPLGIESGGLPGSSTATGSPIADNTAGGFTQAEQVTADGTSTSLVEATPQVIGEPLLATGTLTTNTNQTIVYAAGGVDSSSGTQMGTNIRTNVTTTTTDVSGATIMTGYEADPSFESVTSGTNNFTDFGSTNYLALGRWNGGQTGGSFHGSTVQFDGNDSFHYIMGSPSSNMPTSGTATYSLAASTSPTLDTTATPGSFSGDLAVDFLNSKLAFQLVPTVAGVSYSMETRGWDDANVASSLTNSTLTFSGSQFSASSAGPLNAINVTTSGGAGICGTNGCTGHVSGFFAGDAAQEAGLGYQVLGETLDNRVSGTAIFTKD